MVLASLVRTDSKHFKRAARLFTVVEHAVATSFLAPDEAFLTGSPSESEGLKAGLDSERGDPAGAWPPIGPFVPKKLNQGLERIDGR